MVDASVPSGTINRFWVAGGHANPTYYLSPATPPMGPRYFIEHKEEAGLSSSRLSAIPFRDPLTASSRVGCSSALPS